MGRAVNATCDTVGGGSRQHNWHSHWPPRQVFRSWDITVLGFGLKSASTTPRPVPNQARGAILLTGAGLYACRGRCGQTGSETSEHTS